jgi:hypothetical protein
MYRRGSQYMLFTKVWEPCNLDSFEGVEMHDGAGAKRTSSITHSCATQSRNYIIQIHEGMFSPTDHLGGR